MLYAGSARVSLLLLKSTRVCQQCIGVAQNSRLLPVMVCQKLVIFGLRSPRQMQPKRYRHEKVPQGEASLQPSCIGTLLARSFKMPSKAGT